MSTYIGSDSSEVAAQGFALGAPSLEGSKVVVQEQKRGPFSLLLVVKLHVLKRREWHLLYLVVDLSLPA